VLVTGWVKSSLRRAAIPMLLAALSAGACGKRGEPFFEPPRPLDELAREAAGELAGRPEGLTLAAANGLERFGVLWEQDDWVAAARAGFQARLADPAPLTEEEAAAFRERWGQLDLDPRLRARLLHEGWSVKGEDPAPDAALESLRAAVASGDPGRLLAAWGTARAWFGHLFVDGAREAWGFDGLRARRAEDGWEVTELLGAGRDVVLRRKGGHASLRHVASHETFFFPDRLRAEDEGQ